MKPSFPMIFFVLVMGVVLAGCESAPKKEGESEQLSTLPWNAPEKWEGSGALGGGAVGY